MPQTAPIAEKLFIAEFPTSHNDDKYLYYRQQTFGGGYNFPKYGDQVPERYREEWPEHKLVLIAPDKDSGDGWVIFVYAKDREDQDDDNFNVEYPYGPAEFPRITRDYVLLRSDWLTDGPLALGTADPQVDVEGNPIFPDAVLVGTDELDQQTGDRVIDSLYVKIRRVYEHVPDLNDAEDAAAAKGFGYKVEYPYGLTAYPRVTWRIPCDSIASQVPLTQTCPIAGFTTGTFGNTTSLTSCVTNGTTTVTCASTANLSPGALITGTNITPGTTVASITNATTFVLSAVATGSGSGLTFTTGYYVKLLDQSYENQKGVVVALNRVYEPVYGPVIPESDVDSASFTAVRTTKQIVAQSAVPATAALLTAEMTAAGAGVTIEYKPLGMDGLRSVRIVSSADVSTLDWVVGNANDIVTYGSYDYRFPDVLTAASWVYAEAEIDATYYDGALSLEANIHQGYSGPCPARFTERYTSDPEDSAFIAALPAETPFFPQAVTLPAAAVIVSNGRPSTQSHTFTIPATIHGIITIGAIGSDFIWNASPNYITTEISATTPSALPSPGTYIVAKVEHQRVAHRMWKYTIIEVTMPPS